MASLLSVENLQVQFQTKKGINTAVDGVSFSIEKGRILGIVGESGCGKSVTSMSILQLLGSNARISGGSIKLSFPILEMSQHRPSAISRLKMGQNTCESGTDAVLKTMLFHHLYNLFAHFLINVAIETNLVGFIPTARWFIITG